LEVQRRRERREWDDGLADDWEPLSDRCWTDPQVHYGDGERRSQLIVRATAALEEVLARADGGCVIAASHSTWIARGSRAWAWRAPSISDGRCPRWRSIKSIEVCGASS
jgi:broad specificity phosphatase PhoE